MDMSIYSLGGMLSQCVHIYVLNHYNVHLKYVTTLSIIYQ